MGIHELSAAIWRQRELLELLLFKLTEEQLLLTAGRTAWLSYATREVEQVVRRIDEIDLSRDVELAGVAAEWGAGEITTLRDLIPHAPAPWDEVLTAHLAGLSALVTQIQDVRDANAQYLRTGLRTTQETLAGMGSAGTTYSADGRSQPAPAATHFVDKSL